MSAARPPDSNGNVDFHLVASTFPLESAAYMETKPKNTLLVVICLYGMWALSDPSFLHQTPTIDGYTSRLVSKNKHQGDMCYIEIGL